MITVNSSGENHIVVAPGANEALLSADLDIAEKAFTDCEYVLMQLEIPIETVLHAVSKSARLGKKIILNPAPAQKLPEEIFSKLFLFTPNENEAGFYTGVKVNNIDSARKAAEILLSKGIKNVVITMGAQGAFLKNADDWNLRSSFVQQQKKLKRSQGEKQSDLKDEKNYGQPLFNLRRA